MRVPLFCLSLFSKGGGAGRGAFIFVLLGNIKVSVFIMFIIKSLPQMIKKSRPKNEFLGYSRFSKVKQRLE